MKCYVHNERESIGVCVSCGSFICEECCVEQVGKKVCKGCISKNATVANNSNTSEGKDWLVTLLLFIFLSGWGAHRFYVGKIGSGIAYMLTLGGCGIWWIIDLIAILTGTFTDSNERPLQKK